MSFISIFIGIICPLGLAVAASEVRGDDLAYRARQAVGAAERGTREARERVLDAVAFVWEGVSR